MQRIRNSRAFTLIEVLIALVIIAIALSAIIKALGDSARDADAIKNKTIVHWVAMNVVAEFQTHMLLLSPNSDDVSHGTSTQLKRKYYWVAGRVQGINQKDNKVYQRIYVNVFPNNDHQHRIAHVEAFVLLPQSQAGSDATT